MVRILGRTPAGPVGVAIDRLTMTGHDFIEAAQNEGIWKQAMTMVNDKGGAITVGVLVQILSALVKKQFGLE
ncbi:MAG: hypothetical protein Kow00121_26570 [Elainellaceae cyanobacterium]